jgi:hypothetical protein
MLNEFYILKLVYGRLKTTKVNAFERILNKLKLKTQTNTKC